MTEPLLDGLLLVLQWKALAFMGLGILSDGMFAVAAGTAGEFLRKSRRFLRIQRWFAGTSFIGLGLVAALAGRK